MEQSNDKGAKEQKTRHFDIIEMEGGEVETFHLFVQDCSFYVHACHRPVSTIEGNRVLETRI